ncbi:MAG: hypothetical protein IKA57_00140 [Clostridia bacterium]|nr:hypothetical protein [Clostridia bacterium]
MENITLTQKRTSSPKLFLLLSSIIALLSNVAIIILLGVNGGGLQYYIAPIVLGAMDLLLIASVLLTNYRFKYGLYQSIAYIAIVFVTIVATMVFRYQGNKARIFSLISEIIWIFVHLATMVAVFFTTLRAAKYRKWAMPTGIATFGAFAAACAAYVIYIAVTGYFGQGAVGMLRPLLYEYDQTTKTYTVVGVGEGKGDTIVIPESFDTIKVSKIDCNVFAVDTVKDVYLECANTATFTNLAALSDFNSNVKVHIPKANYDMLRNGLYTQMASVGNVTSIANNVKALTEVMAPAGLAEDEVYVSYTYTKEDLESVNGNYLPTKYLKKGTVFNAADYAEEIPYAAHMSETSDEDLHWSFNNLQQCIFTGFYNGETALEGAKIDKDIQNVSLKFEKIYRVSILDDNDTKYEIEDSFTQTMVNNEALTYRYMTQNTANDILASIQLRDGFDLAWYYGYTEFSDLKGFLKDTIQPSNYEIVSIKPNWTLRVPTITELKTNYADNKVTYGEDLKFSAMAQAPADGFELELKWLKQASVEHTGTTYEIDTIDIDQGGSYTLSVTASWPEKTSLTSNVRQDIDVEVLKRAMPFTWILPAYHGYEALDKTYSVAYDETEIVKEDEITYVIRDAKNITQGVTLRNAGDYEMKIILTGETAERYFVPTHTEEGVEDSDPIQMGETATYTITPHQLDANWDEASFAHTYDGAPYQPFINGTYGIGEEMYTLIDIYMDSAQTHAGTYMAKATSQNPNYILRNPEKQFVINQRPVHFEWDNISELIYNGQEQSVEVISIIDVVFGEEQDILDSLIYTGQGTNVDSYTMNASFPENSNYKYAEDEMGNHDYAILKADLTVVLEAHSKIYDGKIFTANAEEKYSYLCDGLQGKDTFEEVFANFAYAGDAIEAINQGAYVIDTSYDEGEKYGNYNINHDTYVIETTTLTIEQRLVTLTWQENLSNVYNGEEQAVKVIKINNVVAEEEEAQLELLEYTDNVETNVGTYYAHVAFPADSNYAFDIEKNENGQTEFEITKKALTLTITPAEKTYDAKIYVSEVEGEEKNFEYVYDGLVGEDTFEEVIVGIQFAGAATTAINAGEYELSVEFSEGEKYGNYELNENAPYLVKTSTLTIHKRPITVTWQEELSFVYNAASQSIEVVAINEAQGDEGAVAGEEEDILTSLIYTGEQTNVGTHTMTATLPTITNYVFANEETNKQTFDITKKALTVTVTAGATDGKSKIYDGIAYSDYDYAVEGLEGSDLITEVAKDIECVVSLQGTTASVTPTNAGAYEVRVGYGQGAKFGNYDLTTTTDTFEIEHREITLTWQDNTSLEYTAKAQKVEVVALDNVVVSESSAILKSLIYDGAKTNVGAYEMTATLPATSNYVFAEGETGVCAYSITPKALTVTVDDKEVVYTGANYAGDFKVTPVGLAGTDKITEVFVPAYTGAEAARNVGTYEINAENTDAATKAGNYTITIVPGTLTITQRSATVSVNNKTTTYDANVKTGFAITISGKANADNAEDLLTVTSYKGAGTTAVNAGSYDVEVDAYTPGEEFANYSFTFVKGTLTINKKQIAPTWGTSSVTYDGNAQTLTIASVSGLIGADTINMLGITYANNTQTNAGNYTVTATLAENNYIFAEGLSTTTTLAIAQKALTVTVANATHTYNGNVYSSFTYTHNGLVSTDVIGDVLQSVSYETYAAGQKKTAQDAGTYEIRLSYTKGAKADNYVITIKNGTLTINQAEITLTWPTKKSYDSNEVSEAALKATAVGVNGENVALSYTGYSAAEGTHTITASTSNANYKIKNPTFTYTVTVAKSEEKK